MTREEILSKAKQILFTTEMVREILDGRKTVTRRPVKPQPSAEMPNNHNICKMPILTNDGIKTLWYMDVVKQYPFKRTRYFEKVAPYEIGDILYVRETWNYGYDIDENDQIIEGTGRYLYAADNPYPCNDWVMPDGTHRDTMPWRPSIHMPKEAARIFLRVTGVRVERLQDITEDEAKAEGFSSKAEFISAITKMYPNCSAGSWFWVIEFDRVE